ncbi:MAG: hypothetical protein AB7F97_09225 [Solirubrobacterales bacterium]
MIAGREALAATEVIPRFIDQAGAAYLDPRASRDGSSSAIGSSSRRPGRGRWRRGTWSSPWVADSTFELGYGSPVVFRAAKAFLRIGRGSEDVSANRRGDVDLRGDVGLALAALLSVGISTDDRDDGWLAEVIAGNQRKAERLEERMATATELDDGLHPHQLLAAVNRIVDEETIVIADGGDILSWSARASAPLPISTSAPSAASVRGSRTPSPPRSVIRPVG